MGIIEYRTTHWMHLAHPEAVESTTADFLKIEKSIKSIQLYPADTVVMATRDGNSAQVLKFCPAGLALYKSIWDISDAEDQKVLRKHLKRCIWIREQFKKKHGLESARVWYMSIILGATQR